MMSNNSSVVFLFVLATAVLSLGVVIGARAMRAAAVARQATNWPTAAARIEHTAIRERIGSKGRRYYQVVVAYTYKVAGTDYRGSVISPMYGNSGPRQNAENLETELRSGSTVQISYDPAIPNHSMIVPGFLKEGADGLVACGFILLAGLYLGAMATIGMFSRGELISKIVHF